MTYMELSTVPTYMDEFVGHALFHIDTTMFPYVMEGHKNRKQTKTAEVKHAI